MTLRQIVPAAFVLSVLLAALAAPWVAAARMLEVFILGAYLALDGGCALALARRHGARVGLAAAGVLPVLHVSYGLGFLRGLAALRARARGRPMHLRYTPLSR